MRPSAVISIGLVLTSVSGCALTEVRSRSKLGPEFRHKNSNADEVRWYVQQGLDFKWENGLSTGITYRRRDVDDGGGDHDNGVWFEFSFPVWKATKINPLERRIVMLERRLARLEIQPARTGAGQ